VDRGAFQLLEEFNASVFPISEIVKRADAQNNLLLAATPPQQHKQNDNRQPPKNTTQDWRQVLTHSDILGHMSLADAREF
jgi:hypothetical protein